MNKFHLGEEVSLVSKWYPKYNGNYIIQGIKPAGGDYKNSRVWPREVGYDLGVVALEDEVDRINGFTLWDESAIRKRPKPSSQSYSELLKSIKEGLINA